MVKEGWCYGAPLWLAGILCGIALGPWTAAPWVVAAAFCFYFFRDPDRVVPAGPVCVSPADGRIVQVRREHDGRTRISIFLNIFDVHVNRIPVAGLVRSVHYERGRFRLAHLESASEDNERNTLVIQGSKGGVSVEVNQIAGLIARRIVCRKQPGDLVEKGERFGLIKFGSRVDVVLGPEWHIAVVPGDRVAGGSSVLAKRQ